MFVSVLVLWTGCDSYTCWALNAPSEFTCSSPTCQTARLYLSIRLCHTFFHISFLLHPLFWSRCETVASLITPPWVTVCLAPSSAVKIRFEQTRQLLWRVLDETRVKVKVTDSCGNFCPHESGISGGRRILRKNIHGCRVKQVLVFDVDLLVLMQKLCVGVYFKGLKCLN